MLLEVGDGWSKEVRVGGGWSGYGKAGRCGKGLVGIGVGWPRWETGRDERRVRIGGERLG